MPLFSAIFSKSRRLLNISIILVIFLLVALSAGEARLFLGNLSSVVFYTPFIKFKASVEGLRNVADENKQLKNELAQLSLQLSAVGEARRENERLRQLIGFQTPANYRTIPARIVSLYRHFYPVAAIIDKGQYDGVVVNQAVVNRNGLVGKVRDVMGHSATVQLLTDPGNPVSARVADTRQIGVVKFNLQTGMLFDDLPADAVVKKGDLIISSGLGGIYPPGLAVATVDSVYPNEGDILKHVSLRPTVNFFEIDEIYVLADEVK